MRTGSTGAGADDGIYFDMFKSTLMQQVLLIQKERHTSNFRQSSIVISVVIKRCTGMQVNVLKCSKELSCISCLYLTF